MNPHHPTTVVDPQASPLHASHRATENPQADWQADLARAGGRAALWREQSLWALRVYRYGRWVDAQRPGWARRWRTRWYWVCFRLVETLTGISLPKEAQVGPGLRIWHFGGVFINPATRIGAGCTLRQGVTLGNRAEGGPSPVLEDGVDLGAYAQVLGGVRLGAGCKVGAMAVVLRDVPPGATAVGNPARLIAATAPGPTE
jgi:serine O-acetyltransferase